jgi:ABC-type sugar transport system ATPase subunit
MNVELLRISKRFDRLQALSDVSVRIRSGTVHALVGENGAGKSTLAKILAGVERPDEGEIRVDGIRVGYASPRDALADGITIIAQELALEPGRSVIDNVFLGIESKRWGLLDHRAMRARYQQLVSKASLRVKPETLVGRLRTADQQRVEILRALARDARLIIMDEPTAALTSQEAARFLELVRGLRADGTTIVYVSHFLNEVLQVADDVTVLRDGRHVKTGPASKESPPSLVAAMLGGPTDLSFPDRSDRSVRGDVVLSVRKLGRPPAFEDITFEVRAGEIVGLAGLIGSGRTEVARAIFGADPVREGTVEMVGSSRRRHTPRDAIRSGLAMLPESRKQGLLLRRSIVENVTLPHLSLFSSLGVMSTRQEAGRTADIARQLDIKAPNMRTHISKLSGGNQQKTMFAKWLLKAPSVLLIDEPTRGVDVGAKHAIYRIIDALARDGMGVLLISSEIEEVLGLSDRILVMRNGRLAGEFASGEVDEDAILRAAFGAQAPETV